MKNIESPEVNTHQGISIKVDGFGNFVAILEGKVEDEKIRFQEDTLEKVKALIDKHFLMKKKFKAIEVIDIFGHKLAKITSQRVDVPDIYWLTWKTKGGRSERGQHTLGSNKKPYFCFRTPENLELLTLVRVKLAEIKARQDELSALEMRFTNFVTEEYIEKEMGI